MAESLSQPLIAPLSPATAQATGESPLSDLLTILEKEIATTVSLSSPSRCATEVPKGFVFGLDDGTVALLSKELTVTAIGKHSEKVVAVKSAGTLVVSASEDKSLRLWDSELNCEVGRLEAHTSVITAVLVCGNKTIVSGAKDGSVFAWSIEERKQIAALSGHSASISSIVRTPDDSKIITGSQDRTIIVWDFLSFSQISVLTGHTDRVWSLAVTPDSQRLVSASQEKKLKVWDLANYTEIATVEGHSRPIYKVMVWPEGQFALSAGIEDGINVWRLSDYGKETNLKHSGFIVDLAATGDGRFLITAAQQRGIKVWTGPPFTELATLGGEGRVYNFLLSRDDCRLAATPQDATVRLWDLSEGDAQKFSQGRKVSYVSAMSPEHTLLAAPKRQQEECQTDILLVDSLTYSPIRQIFTAPDEVKEIAASESGRRALITTKNSLLLVDFSADTVTNLNADSSQGVICCAAIRLDGKLAVSGSSENLKVWDLDERKEIREMKGHSKTVECVRIAQDGRHAVSSAHDGLVRIWCLNTFTSTASLVSESGIVFSILLIPQRDFILSGSGKGSIDVWSEGRQRQVAALRVHSDTVTVLLQLPDCEHVLSGSKDKSICLWSLRRMELIRQVDCSAVVTSMALARKPGTVVVPQGTDIEEFNFYCYVKTYRQEAIREFKAGRSLASPQWKQTLMLANLSQLRRGDAIALPLSQSILLPYFLTPLHIYAHCNHPQTLKATLESASVPFLRSCLGSPLSLALQQNARKCVDVLVTALRERCERGVACSDVEEVAEDIPSLLAFQSKSLPPLLQLLLSPLQSEFLPEYISPMHDLPVTIFHAGKSPCIENFAKYSGGKMAEKASKEVKYHISLFDWTFLSGSSDSLRLLTALEACEDRKALTTPLFSRLIQYKWDSFLPLTYAMTALYVLLVLTLVGIHFEYYEKPVLSTLFLALNCVFLLYETVQGISTGFSYVTDVWNAIDLIRAAASLCYGLEELLYGSSIVYVKVTAAALTFYRGFTFFRTFAATRMFVRMTLEVVKEMYAFLVILVYSTFSFGFLYAVLDKENIQGVTGAWVVAYELLMGNANNEGFGTLQWLCFTAASFLNIIIMLNLLVSILGDAYSTAQESYQELDLLEMLRAVIEYEHLLSWRRHAVAPVYLVACEECCEIDDSQDIAEKIEKLDEKLMQELAEIRSELRLISSKLA